MKFPYRQYLSQYPGTSDFHLILRPVITVRITGPRASARWDALVDTGADETLLPLSLGEVLGVTLDHDTTSQAAGIACLLCDCFLVSRTLSTSCSAIRCSLSATPQSLFGLGLVRLGQSTRRRVLADAVRPTAAEQAGRHRNGASRTVRKCSRPATVGRAVGQTAAGPSLAFRR
jgi:hypothetical protein